MHDCHITLGARWYNWILHLRVSTSVSSVGKGHWELFGDKLVETQNFLYKQPKECWNLVKSGGTHLQSKNAAIVFLPNSSNYLSDFFELIILSSNAVAWYTTCSARRMPLWKHPLSIRTNLFWPSQWCGIELRAYTATVCWHQRILTTSDNKVQRNLDLLNDACVATCNVRY